MSYAEIRAQVLAQLAPDEPDAVAVLQGLAYAAVQGGVQGAALDLYDELARKSWP
jgi:hypothetical protein